MNDWVGTLPRCLGGVLLADTSKRALQLPSLGWKPLLARASKDYKTECRSTASWAESDDAIVTDSIASPSIFP